MRHKSTVAVLLLLGAFSAGCSRDPEQLKMEYVASGDQFVAQKKYSDAMIQYRNAIVQDSRFGAARFKLAKAAEANGDALTAYREYIRAADLMPNDVDVQLRAGQVLILTKQYAEARTRADAVLQKDPKSVAGLILMGNALAGLKDFSGAISELEDAIENDPRRTLSYANLGVVALAKGDTKAAEAAFKRAVALDPKSTSAHLSLANYFWAANRLQDAEAEFKTALGLEPKSPVVLRGMTAFYSQTNRPSETESSLKALVAVSNDTGPRFMLADFYLSHERPAEATALLEPLAKEKEGFVPARVRLAAIQYMDNRRPQAYETVDAAIKQAPTDEQALLLKSRFLLVDRKPAEALALASRVVEANPQALQAMYYKGLALAASGANNEAITVLNELLKRVPSEVAVQIKLAELYLARGETKAAAELSSQAIKSRPTSGMAHLLLARAMLGEGNLTRAESELEIVFRANPESAPVQTLFGRIYSGKGDLKRARAAYERALQFEPESIDALDGLVRTDLLGKDGAAAIARIEARLAKTPPDATLLNLAGATYIATGDAKRAEAAFRKAAEVDPANFEAYRHLANLYVQQNRLDDAKKEYEEATRRRPAEASGARTMLGIISALQNKPTEALKHYEEALTINPQAAVAANNLAWTYAENGANLDIALQLAQTAKAQLPQNAEVSDTLGWIYYKKGLAGLAITALKDGVTQDRSNALIHYHLGLAYAKNGNRPEAQRSLEEALKLDPRFAGADDAKRVLGSLKG